MLVSGLPISGAVIEILGRAMADGAQEAAVAGYERRFGASVFGWSIDGALVAVATVEVDGRQGELVHIASAVAAERRGHARALVDAVVDELSLVSLVAETDEDAVGFYRRAGFDVVAMESPWTTARFRCTLRRISPAGTVTGP